QAHRRALTAIQRANADGIPIDNAFHEIPLPVEALAVGTLLGRRAQPFTGQHRQQDRSDHTQQPPPPPPATAKEDAEVRLTTATTGHETVDRWLVQTWQPTPDRRPGLHQATIMTGL